MSQRFTDSVPLQGVRRTADGYLVGSFRCARTGVQTYLRKELGLSDGDPFGVVRVYRPPEAVFDEDSLKTYAGKPITIEHPKESVKADNWKSLAVGSVGHKVIRDGDTVVVEGVIMDSEAIDLIVAGKREVSMGYQTPMALQDGVTPEGEPYDAIQVGPIKINHLAVVDNARGGSSLRFGDAAPQANWGASPITHQDGVIKMSMKNVVLGDSAVSLPIADAALVEAFKADMTKQLNDAKAEVEEAKAKAKKDADEKDEQLGKLRAEKKELEDAAMTPEKLTGLIAARVALEGQVKTLDSSIVCDGVADDDLKRAAVASRYGEELIADATPAEINGMFKGLLAVATAPQDSFREAMRGARPIVDSTSGWTDSVAAAAGVKFKK